MSTAPRDQEDMPGASQISDAELWERAKAAVGRQATEREYGVVEESRFLEAYPLPWRAEVLSGLNRSYVYAADGTQVIFGMNNAKAAFIADAVNRADSEVQDVSWRRVNDEPFEYAIQQGPNGDEFVKLLNGTCLRRRCRHDP